MKTSLKNIAKEKSVLARYEHFSACPIHLASVASQVNRLAANPQPIIKGKIMNQQLSFLISEIENDRQPKAVGVEQQVIILPEIPVLQLWQPWASWVVEGWKTIETRTHKNFAWMLNHKVAIHACKKWDDAALEIAGEYLTEYQRAKTMQFRKIAGCIIGTAIVENFGLLDDRHSKDALIECNTKRFGLFLRDIVKINPIPFKGAQHQLYINEAKL